MSPTKVQDRPTQLPATQVEDAWQNDPFSPPAAPVTGNLDAAELLPEDRFEDVPMLEEGMKPSLAESRQPFTVLGVFERQSDKYDKKWFWVAIIDIGGSVFRATFGGQDPQWDRWLRIKEQLDSGYTSVGPVMLTEIDTGKGNPFFKVVAWRDDPKQARLT